MARFGPRFVLIQVTSFTCALLLSIQLTKLLFADACPTFMGRECNNHGECSPLGYCLCDEYFSGDACHETAVHGYVAATNSICNGFGSVTLSAPEPFPECVETKPTPFRARSGGWGTAECQRLVHEATRRVYEFETATEKDVLAIPMCICKPPFGGPGCTQQCPMRSDGAVCSDAGNRTVGFINNGTSDGVGCQCRSPISLPEIVPFLTREQALLIYLDLDSFIGGVCARLVTTEAGRTVVVPDVDYVCRCDEKHYGDICQFGACPENDAGIFCSGKGAPTKGFGYEANSTRVVGLYGDPGVPHCVVGKDGCCFEDQSICKLKQQRCDKDSAPLRCSSTTLCVPKPTKNKCGEKWEFGYYDDPVNAPKRKLQNETSWLDSPLVWFEFRVPPSSLSFSFTYDGVTRSWNGIDEFWKGVLSRTVDSVSRDAFVDAYPATVSVDTNDGFVSAWPAPSRNGDDDVPIMFRLRSRNGQFAVVDVAGSRVEFNEAGEDFVFNRTAGVYLRPGNSEVDAETCFADLEACAWTREGVSLDGRSRLCRVGAVVGSVSSSFSCPSVVGDIAMQAVVTVLYGKPRVAGVDWEDEWTMQEFVGPARSKSLVVQTQIAGWSGSVVTVNDLRVPCACEPPILPERNQTIWNRKWIDEFNRPAIQTVGARAVALVESYGDARVVRGILQSDSRIVSSEGSEVFTYTRAKRLSQYEYRLGRPAPNDYAFPARCPGGGAASIRVVTRPDAPASTECVMGVSSTVCDNGCACTTEACSCPSEPESEAPLHAFIAQHVAGAECWITRGHRGRVDPGSAPGCFRTPAAYISPLEFTVEGDFSDEPLEVAGRAHVDDAFVVLPSESSFSANRTAVRPIVDDSETPLSEWCVRYATNSSPVAHVSASWSPVGAGASLLRTHGYTISTSENQQDAQNVVWNDDAYWESTMDSSWIRIDFDRPARVVGLVVVFRSLGLYVNPEFGAMNMSVTVQTGGPESRNDSKRKDWDFNGYLWSDVVNGTAETYLPMNVASARSLRILSRFPMSVRRVVPLTDQDCSLGLLAPGPRLPDDDVRYVDANDGGNSSTECVFNDDCILAGVPAGKDGVCSDYKYLTWGLPPTIRKEINVAWNATQVGYYNYPNGTNLTGMSAACDGKCCVWGFAPLPPPPSSCNSTLVFDSFEFTISGLTETPETGLYTVYYTSQQYGNDLNEWVNACGNGTDGTDCGRSSRTQALDPGVPCSSQTVDRSLPTLLAGGTTLTFTASYTRTLVFPGRGPCGDCDGRHRCEDGTCADSAAQCPVCFYKHPGDGCVTLDGQRHAFKCACDLGWAGFSCSKTKCDELDMRTGAGDPNSKCTCGGINDVKFPKIRARPPFDARLKKGGFSSNELLKLNRRTPRASDRDVGWVNIRATEQSFGDAVLRNFMYNGVSYQTNCFFYKRVPDGRLLQLEDFVQRRSDAYPFEVLEWKTWWNRETNRTETYAWDSPKFETKYDDAPFRCKSGSSCVADPSECDRMDVVNPPCGGHGTCRADSSCACDSGFTTFVLTESVSRAVSVPYYSVDGVPDPTAWGKPDPVQFDSAVCQARDCAVVDCSPPHGCFPGTPALRFADKSVMCASDTGHGGRCGIDKHACARGEVSDQLPCSGNGVLRKSDYRDEWTCVCGTTKGGIDPRETNELSPNGYGGPGCGQYWCGESSTKIWIQRTNPVSRGPYMGADGSELPFVWKGPCGAPVGPRPEDAVAWQRCCPGIKRLERCRYVPCARGAGADKVVSCELAEKCLGAQTTPMVFVCNGHGKARADGTCECDAIDGGGYTHDAETFSYEGCYRLAQCAKGANGNTCNKPDDCEPMEYWSEFPKIEYVEQQWQTLLLQAGIAPTNRSFVDFVFKDRREERLKTVMSQIAQKVIDAVVQAATDVAVYPNDDPNDPVGMMPYDPEKVCSYMEGYESPYLRNKDAIWVDAENVKTILTDGKFGSGSVLPNVDYVTLSENIVIAYPETITLDQVRVHARRVSSPGSTTAGIEFHGLSDYVCNDVEVSDATQFAWYSLRCVPTYAPFDFKAEYSVEFASYCRPSESAGSCQRWKDEKCALRGYAINDPRFFENAYVGCQDARCCVPKTTQFEPTGFISVRPRAGTTVDIDEMQLYTHALAVMPTPESLNREIRYREDTNTVCRDGKFMSYLFGSPLTYYKQRDWTTPRMWPVPRSDHNWDSAVAACEDTGGVLASSRGFTSAINGYASDMGQICFGLETNERPTEDAAVVDTKCLVAARERSEKRVGNMTDFVLPSCLAYGCWTPASENYTLAPFDYVSTPKNDTDGTMWKSEWISPSTGFISTRDATVQLRKEGARQKWLTRTPPRPVRWGDVLYRYIDEYDVVQGLETPYWQRVGINSMADSNYYSWLYRRDKTVGRPFLFTSDPGQVAQPTVKVWSNPQVCTVTVYSAPMCGRFFGRPLGHPLSEGGVKRTYIVTPADDYAVLDIENLLETPGYDRWTECVGSNPTCDGGLGQRMRCDPCEAEGIQSVSIQGPCMIEFRGPGYRYYVSEAGTVVTPIHFQNVGVLRHYGCSPDLVGQWIDGCYGQFVRDNGINGWFCSECGMLGCLPAGWDPHIDVMPAQTGNAPNGFPIGSATYMKIHAKFTSRRLQITHRANPTATIADENDFALGQDRHPYMCSNVRVVETKRVWAGKRNATYDVVDHSPRDALGEFVPVRVKRLAAGITLKRYVQDGGTGPGAEVDAPLATFIPVESRMTPYAFTYLEYKANVVRGNESTLVLPYVTCESLGRPVRRCRDCLVEQAKDWEWDQRYFNPQNGEFQVSVSTMNATGQATRDTKPRLHASWTSTALENVVRPYEALESIEFSEPKAYARLISGTRSEDYRRDTLEVNVTTPAIYLDWCVTVARGPNGVGYLFHPTVCEAPVHKALCVRDILKHTVQPGCQADACGSAGRVGFFETNGTVFTSNPMAKREDYPAEHEIADAYSTGDFSAFLDSKPIPVNEIAAYIRSLPQAFITSMPGFFERFETSTRAGRLSPGEVADRVKPIDLTFTKWFPHDCGVVYNGKTGVGRAMCAQSADQCVRNDEFPLAQTPMALADYPTGLASIPDGVVATEEPACGRFVSPADLVAATEDDAPAPAQGAYVVVEAIKGKHVVIRTTQSNGFFRNSRRDLDRFRNGTTFFGSVQCSVTPCNVSLLATSLESKFLDPEYALDLGQAAVHSTFSVTLDSNQTYWRTLAFAWFDLPIGTTLHIDRVLVTDAESIEECRRASRLDRPWVEVPPSADSPAPQHQCLLKGENAGTCFCPDSSPFGGPTCDYPAVFTKHGKLICGAFPGTHPSKSRAVAPDGSLVYANEYGVYEWHDEGGVKRFGCKTRADVGSRVKSRLVDGSAHDFRYVIKNVDSPNLETFIEPTAEDAERAKLLTFPLGPAEVDVLCASKSSTLPSFSTGNEIAKYLAKNRTGVVVDLVRTEDGELRWDQRSETFRYCETDVDPTCGVTNYTTTPCDVTTGSVEVLAAAAAECRALQFTNLAFSPTAGFLTDGSGSVSEWVPTLTEIILTRFAPSPGGIIVTVVTNSALSLEVFAFCPTCVALTGTECTQSLTDARSFSCIKNDVSSIKLKRVGGVYASEVGAFATGDEWRPVPFNY